MNDISQSLQDQVNQAIADKQSVYITGGNSKSFYGHKVDAQPINIAQHSGVTSYEPTELVITARAGTPLSELEKLLADNNQCLPFEPPRFGENATLGGTIACNLSGPARPYSGAARDYVLGCKIINGKGEILSFGGEVMKNVAGYDVSRLMAGSFGTLGILLEISLKVLPINEKTVTLRKELDFSQAQQLLTDISLTPVPLTASCYDGYYLYLRFSGAEAGVDAVVKQQGGEILADNNFWQDLKEHKLDFFDSDEKLWRLSVAADTPPLALPGKVLYDWGNTQRWLKTSSSSDEIRALVQQYGGHATLFRNAGENDLIFHPLSEALKQIHQNLKTAFDPMHIFNPGRMYPGL